MAKFFQRLSGDGDNKHFQAKHRESCVSAISMPDGLTDEDWLDDEDEDEDEDGYWNDTTGTTNAGEIPPEGPRCDRQKHEAHQAAKDASSIKGFNKNFTVSKVKVTNDLTNPAAASTADNHSYYIQTIIDLKMKLAIESSAKDELHMMIKHSTTEKRELEQELCTVLEERNKFAARAKDCNNKSVFTEVTSSMTTKSSSIQSSFTSSLNSSCRSSMSLLSSSIISAATSGGAGPTTTPGASTLSLQEILDLISENTFLLTENTALSAENTRLQQEMNHLRSSFRVYMEKSGGGTIDAEAGKLLFGKQRRNSLSGPSSSSASNLSRGRSGVRRGVSGGDHQQKPHQAATTNTPPSIKTSIKNLVAVAGDGIVTNNGPVIRDNHTMLPPREDSMSSSSSSSRSVKQRSCIKRTIHPSSSRSYCASGGYDASSMSTTGRANEEWGVIKQGSEMGAGAGAGGNNALDTGVYLLRRLSCSSSSLHSHQEVCENTGGP